jgi:hypothetical protein
MFLYFFRSLSIAESSSAMLARLKSISLTIQCSEMGKDAALMLMKQAIPCTPGKVDGKNIPTMLLAIGAEVFQKHRSRSSLSQSSYIKLF